MWEPRVYQTEWLRNLIDKSQMNIGDLLCHHRSGGHLVLMKKQHLVLKSVPLVSMRMRRNTQGCLQNGPLSFL